MPEKYTTYRGPTGHRIVEDQHGEKVAIFHFVGPDMVNRAYGAFIAGCAETKATLYDKDREYFVVADVLELDESKELGQIDWLAPI